MGRASFIIWAEDEREDGRSGRQSMRYDGPIQPGMVFECVGHPLVDVVVGDLRTIECVPPRYIDIGFTDGKNLDEEDFRRAFRPVPTSRTDGGKL